MRRNPGGNVPVLDGDYIPMASQYSATPSPHILSHQKPVMQNIYADEALKSPDAPQNDLNQHVQLQRNPSYGQLGQPGNAALQSSSPPPPLPPKPAPRTRANSLQQQPRQRPPLQAGGFQFSQPPRMARSTMEGNVGNIHNPQRPPVSGVPLSQAGGGQPTPSPVLNEARPIGSDGRHYTHHPNTKDLLQQVHHLNAKVSDTEARLRDRELELSQCHTELSKVRQCLLDKKEELKQLNIEFQRLTSNYNHLQQTGGRAQPQVAQTEAALQVQVQHQKKVADELRQQLERLRLQSPPPLSPAVAGHPTVNMQELQRLRDEVQRYREDKQRMEQKMQMLTSQKEILEHQVTTYEQDFKSERKDRVGMATKMEKMQGEIDNLNQIVRMLGGEHQPP